MLPARPRDETRSTCTSCVTPCSTTATRVSCGVTLTRISSVIAMGLDQDVELLQQLRRFREREAHDAGIAAGHPRDERPRPSLDGIGPGFVERLAGRDVAADVDV